MIFTETIGEPRLKGGKKRGGGGLMGETWHCLATEQQLDVII